MEPTFFAAPDDLRRWFAEHQASAPELLAGFYKCGSGERSVTWPESVDEALCVGWIDGVRRGLDERRYTIRFTPRRKGSVWSAVNIRRVEALTAEGRMQPAGLAAFAARTENRSGIYSYEQRDRELAEPYAGWFRANADAWRFFEAQAPSYRKTMEWWVVSAQREETRRKRLTRLIAESAAGRRMR